MPRQRLAASAAAADAATALTPELIRSHRRPVRRFQVAGAFILVFGAVAGSSAVLGRDRATPGPVSADVATVIPVDNISEEMAVARAIAKAKAEAAAVAEAERVRKANEVAQKQAEAKKTPTPNVPSSCNEYTGNRALGCAILLEVGFGLNQMPCLEAIWTKESNWNPSSHNTSSGAHGIPQALPASKMAPYGADYLTNPVPQIRWGLDYIKQRYGTPCQAWSFWQAHNWY